MQVRSREAVYMLKLYFFQKNNNNAISAFLSYQGPAKMYKPFLLFFCLLLYSDQVLFEYEVLDCYQVLQVLCII